MTSKRLSASILSRSLGELELAILQTLWQSSDLNAKAIQERLTVSRRVGMSAIQSSLENLRKKELISFRKQRQAFVYTATISRSELLGQFVGDIIHTLHDGKLETILSSFVYVASNINDDALEDLEKLIKDKREQNKIKPEKDSVKEPK